MNASRRSLESAWNLLLTLLLAPGIVAHEGAHVLACRVTGVRVHGSRFLNPFAGDAYVDHERIESFAADVTIAVAPLVVNSTAAAGAFVASGSVENVPTTALLLWVGGTLAVTAFPTRSDTATLFRTVGSAPRWTRPAGVATAGVLRGFTLVPGAPGVAGYLWMVALYGATMPGGAPF